MKNIALIFVFNVLTLISFSQTISDVIEGALGAVVTVAVYKSDFAKKTLGFRGESYASTEAYAKALDLSGAKSSGSGFIVSKSNKKYVITNAHVIENASSDTGSIFIFSISRKKYEVKIVGGDSFYDFAVLEFVGKPGLEISELQFSDAVPRVGESVYAIGNPLGEYPYTVTDGIISAKNRARGGTTGKFGFIQTTATVIWGNSGGPLIDKTGKVAGINSQIAFADTPGEGSIWQSQINFALESAVSIRLFNDIISNKGKVKRAYFGLIFSQISRSSSPKSEVITNSDEHQPVIDGVLKNAPSFELIQQYKGAKVLEVNSESVRNVEEIMGEFEKIAPGSNVTLRIKFNGTENILTLKSRLFIESDHDQIAIDFIRNTKIFELDNEHPQVVLTQKASGGFYLRDKMSELKKLKELKYSEDAENSKFIVLAAGIYNKESSSLWKTENLHDFGAAIRINSLTGIIDLCLIPYSSLNPEDIQFARYYLSGQEDILKAILFY